MNLQKTIDTHRARLTAAQAFADAFGSKLPDNFPGHLGMEYGLIFGTSVPEHSERADAERLLALVGEVFGREGWTRKLSYDKTHFDWTRAIGGVAVCIGNVERIDDPRDGSPVLPGAFPILLAENAETVA